jgi:RNA polymerase sigma factor (sigma-70 family)
MAQTTEPTPYDFLNDTVLRRIDYRVARLGRKYGLSREDREDLRQEFCLTVFRAGSKFDPAQCTAERFVRMVLNRCYKHFVRKLARAAENRAQSVVAVAMDMSDSDCEHCLIDPSSEDDRQRFEMAEDVRTVIAGLPEDLAELARDMMSLSPPQIARKRGVHHSTIYRAIAKLREHFTNAGIDGVF